jgi:hypothetical protein
LCFAVISLTILLSYGYQGLKEPRCFEKTCLQVRCLFFSGYSVSKAFFKYAFYDGKFPYLKVVSTPNATVNYATAIETAGNVNFVGLNDKKA